MKNYNTILEDCLKNAIDFNSLERLKYKIKNKNFEAIQNNKVFTFIAIFKENIYFKNLKVITVPAVEEYLNNDIKFKQWLIDNTDFESYKIKLLKIDSKGISHILQLDCSLNYKELCCKTY